jgi:hypothetical protein
MSAPPAKKADEALSFANRVAIDRTTITVIVRSSSKDACKIRVLGSFTIAASCETDKAVSLLSIALPQKFGPATFLAIAGPSHQIFRRWWLSSILQLHICM